MRALLWLYLTLVAAALGGCANYATLQVPETMAEDKFQLGVGATVNSYPLEIESTTTTIDTNGVSHQTTTTDQETFIVPALTLSGRYGLSDHLEVHGIAWLPFGLSVGGKYMLIGDRKAGGFAFSPGIDASIPITVSVNGDSSLLMDVYVPLHMGYRTGADFELYWTPKYVMRLFDGQVGHAAGGTLGVALGDTTQFLIEGGALYDTLYKKPIFNGAIGLAFN